MKNKFGLTPKQEKELARQFRMKGYSPNIEKLALDLLDCLGGEAPGLTNLKQTNRFFAELEVKLTPREKNQVISKAEELVTNP